jgi:hypothetical protein
MHYEQLLGADGQPKTVKSRSHRWSRPYVFRMACFSRHSCPFSTLFSDWICSSIHEVLGG